jgi:hypothetical protein
VSQAPDHGVAAGLQHLDRPAVELVPALEVALVGGCSGQGQEQLDVAAAGPRLGVGHPVPQGQGTLPVGDGLGCADPPGHLARTHGRLQGARQVVRGVPVEGHAAQRRQARVRVLVDPPLEDRRQPRVEPGALVGQQVVVHGLTQETVPERERAVGAPEEVRVEQLAQRRVELLLVEAGQLRDGVRVDAGAVHRGDTQQLARDVGQRVDPRQEQVGQLCGDPP